MPPFKNWTPPAFGTGAARPVAVPTPQDPLQAAYARGVTEGRRDGAAAAAQQLATARQAVEGAGRAVAEVRAAVAGDIEQTVTVLAMAIAQRMVVHEMQTDPATIGELVRRTIASLPPSAPPLVRVHPDDLAALDSVTPSVADNNRDVDVEWAPDPAVERGGFIVETPQRVLDAQLSSVFRDLYERLRDA